MDDEQILADAQEQINQRKKKPQSYEITNDISRYLRKVAKPAAKNISVPQAFAEIVGTQLAGKCEIKSVKAGTLTVAVSAGAYMFMLKSRAEEITAKLAAECPAAKIKKIKLVCKRN